MHTPADEYGCKVVRQFGAGIDTGKDSDERDAYVYGRSELVWIVGQFQCGLCAFVTFLYIGVQT